MKRILTGLAVLVVIGLGLAFAFRGPLAMHLVKRIAERNMAANLQNELPDGLHAVVCGSGSPFTDATRAGPCLAIVAGKHLYLIDVGDGAPETLARTGLRPGNVDAVFLTHFHSDHIDGLGNLNVQRWVGGSHTDRLPLYGVDGVQRLAAGFDEAYALDDGYRTAHHGVAVAPPSGSGYVPVVFATPVAGTAVVVLEQEGLKVTAFRVEHDPANPAVGYRFDYKGRSIVVSGDTRACPEVVRMAKGADLLVHEALSKSMVATLRQAALDNHRDNVAKVLADIPGYHTSPQEAAGVATQAGVRSLLLTHLIPPLPLRALEGPFLGDSRHIFKGQLWLARDGDMVSLPAGGDAILHRKTHL